MTGLIDLDFLKDFEENLDPKKGISKYEMNILGYGEISVVFEVREQEGIALKRIPNFKPEEVEAYIDLFHEYESLLKEAGLKLPRSDAAYVLRGDKAILYIAQERLESENVCNKVIHKIKNDEFKELFLRILNELRKVWDFNEKSVVTGTEIGIDGQISNFALKNGDLLYFDTSTPMVRRNGEHQINAEVFLRAAPPIMRTIVKRLFLQEILDRYFDFRLVVVDLLANLFKEKRKDAIPMLLDVANEFLSEFGIKNITYKEIEKYYKEDAFIWSLYLNLRKLHRFTAKIFGMRYEYFLPEKIER
ncbi:MAG: hypothetical protein H0Z28_12680 [Archaeoglobus sp.]|nr:hypothetical protein [Archaeoglobus sp.]